MTILNRLLLAASPATSARSWPWKVCVFLLFATALSYLDRQALSVVAPVVAGELGLDNALLGLLLSAFFYAYSAMHIPVGYLLDRFNIRRTYALFVLLWSVSQVLVGLRRGFGDHWGALCPRRLWDSRPNRRCSHLRADVLDGFSLDWDGLARSIRSVGVESAILATDLRQPENPRPVEGLAIMRRELSRRGFTDSELKQMMCVAPAKLLDL